MENHKFDSYNILMEKKCILMQEFMNAPDRNTSNIIKDEIFNLDMQIMQYIDNSLSPYFMAVNNERNN
jgi:hypothetical protein